MPGDTFARDTCPTCGRCRVMRARSLGQYDPTGGVGHESCRNFCNCEPFVPYQSSESLDSGSSFVRARDRGLSFFTPAHTDVYLEGAYDPSPITNPGRTFGAFCRALAPSTIGGSECTRHVGHEGDHAVHQIPRQQDSYAFMPMISRWSRDFMPGHVNAQCSNCSSYMNRGDGFDSCTSPECRRRQQCTRCCACNRINYREQTGRNFIGEATKRYPRYVGVEIECGKNANSKVRGFHKVQKARDKWGFRIGSDGSINGFSAATTEISTVPARGDKFDEQALDLGNALIADDLKANSSCGLHVHVDVRDYTNDHLMSFVFLYSVLETSLYKLVAFSRKANHFSQSWNDKLQIACDEKLSVAERAKQLDIILYGSESSARSVKTSRSKQSCRYHGVNFNSIPVHGTIEFRLHHGTVNPIKIRMWTAVCSSIVEYCFSHTEAEIRTLVKETKNGTAILEKVIGDPEVVAWTRARRLFFANMERKRRGLTPLARAEKAIAAEARRRVPGALPDPGEAEMSETGN